MDWSYTQLLTDIDALFQKLVGTPNLKTLSYQSVFFEAFALDPHNIKLSQLRALGLRYLKMEDQELTETDWLELLFDHGMQAHTTSDPHHSGPIAVVEYPTPLAQLAKTGPAISSQTNKDVAYRFEVYWQGLEIANGYQELTDATELMTRWQRQRLQDCPAPDWQGRQDPRLLAAMAHGLPECSGCALGFDRFFFANTGQPRLAQTLTFDFRLA